MSDATKITKDSHKGHEDHQGMAITGQRIDLIGNRCLIVELKAAARVDPVHEAKVLSYRPNDCDCDWG